MYMRVCKIAYISQFKLELFPPNDFTFFISSQMNLKTLKIAVGLVSFFAIILVIFYHLPVKKLVFLSNISFSQTGKSLAHDGGASKSWPRNLIFPWLSILNSHKCNENEEWSMKFRSLDLKLVCKRNAEPCYVWYLDGPNGTLTYSNKTMAVDALKPTRFCPIIVHGERAAVTLNSQKCKESEEWRMKFRYLDVKFVCKRNTEPCYAWHWDVANWTLTYFNKTIAVDVLNPTRFCPVPIQGERTARIINSDRSVQYPGCTLKKYPCSPSLGSFYGSFDKNMKLRINRSPCCRKLLIDITHHMGRVFDEYNVTYFLTGGAVISLVRDNGELIPYDVDTDVSVDGNDKDKVIKALPLLRKPGYIFKWGAYGDKTYMVGCTNERCLNGPGISFYTIKEGIVKALTKEVQNVPADIAIPPIRGKFEGLEMSFPKEPVKYLDYIYGKEKWKTPLNCTAHYYGQCKA